MRPQTFIPALILLLAAAMAQASEEVRRVQEELRKRNLYFGEVDGRITDETTGAIRRYQERKGFPASGTINPETLRSLDITSAKADDQWPEGPVLKSDAARELAESDRKYLESLAAKDLPAVGEPPPSELEPVSSTPPAAATPPPPNLEETLKGFVKEYLDACESNKLDEEMSFYAPRMVYFDHGRVDREFVATDVNRFYHHWPQRRYELLDFKVNQTQGPDTDVTFRIAFHYKKGTKQVSGKSDNFFKIRREGELMYFTSLKEQRVRE